MAKQQQFGGFGQGVVKTREDGSQYVFDPVAKKSWSMDSAKGMFLTGQDPNKAKKKFGSDRVYREAYALETGGKSQYNTGVTKTDSGYSASYDPKKNKKSGTAPVTDVIPPSTGPTVGTDSNAKTIQKIQEILSQPGVSATREANLQQKYNELTGNKGLVPRLGQELKPGQSTTPTATTPSSTVQPAPMPTVEPTPETPAEMPTVAPTETDAAPMPTVPGEVPTTVTKEGDQPTGDINPEVTATVPAAAPDIASLEQQAKANGLSDKNLAAAKDAFQKGYMTEESYIEYLNKFQKKEEEDALAIQSSANTTAVTGEVDYYDEAHTSNLESQQTPDLQDSSGAQWVSSSLESSFQNLLSSGMDLNNMTSADLAKYTLMMAFDTSMDDAETKYLDTMATLAQSTYLNALGDGETTLAEIDAAISGEDFTASTWEGLQAKVAAQSNSIALENIKGEQDYLESQYEIQKAEDERRNAKLEGYLKAKLYAMGAEDSTAGLSIISENMHMAQMEMDKRDATYTYNRGQLNRAYRQTVVDYTGAIGEIVMTAQSKASTALADYQTSLMGIEKERLTSDKEKRTAKMEAMQAYLTFTQTAEKNANDEKWKTLDFYYKQSQDMVDRSFKMSGLTGTIFTIDPTTGELVDTGMATFDATKYQNDYALSVANFSLAQSRFSLDQSQFAYQQMNDRNTKLMELATDPDVLAMSEEDRLALGAMFDQNFGVPQGTFGSDASTWGSTMSGYAGAMQTGGAYYEAGLSESATASIQSFLDSGEPISAYSEKYMNLNPMDVPEVSQFLMSVGASGAGAITQEFGMTDYAQGGAYGGAPHRGFDLTFKDGQVHSATTGTVIKVQPSDGKNPYGGYVWVQDDNGLVWQYAHMPKDPGAYSVQLGQRVGQGDSLGMMGSEGAATGVHTHLSAIGATQNALMPTYGNSEWEKGLGSFMDSINMTPFDQIMQPYQMSPYAWSPTASFLGGLTGSGTSYDVDTALDLRTKYVAESGDFNTVQQSYKVITNTGDSAAGDLSLVFAYMKMLDPGSAVKEAEYANAENAKGVPETVRNLYNKVMTGEFLSAKQRTDFKTQASSIYDTYVGRQQAINAIYQGFAETSGVPPEAILYDLSGDSGLSDIMSQYFPDGFDN